MGGWGWAGLVLVWCKDGSVRVCDELMLALILEMALTLELALTMRLILEMSLELVLALTLGRLKWLWR